MNLVLNNDRRKRRSAQGSALLAVLWLSAALAAIAFSVALTVRGETERVATGEEDVRASYLAEGAVQQAILRMEWAQGGRRQDENTPYFVVGQPRMTLAFPTGVAVVDVIPEASKLNLNYAPPEVLQALFLNLGAPEDQASSLAVAIADWRAPSNESSASGFDQLYLSAQPSFRVPHASFQNIEELLYLPGMTADLFYGTWVRQSDGTRSRLVPRGGVRDCVSVYGSVDRFDVNTVQPAVLAAVGSSPEEIAALVERRRAAPIVQNDLQQVSGAGGGGLMSHVGIASHTIYTFRATARMRRPDGSLSDLRRVVAATVKFLPAGVSDKPFHILRWYDRG